MKIFKVLPLATANERLALDLEQVISVIDKIESFYSTVAANGISDIALDVHLSIQEVIPEVLADVERVCKEDRFLNAFRKMYFFITNYSLEELYEMDASAEIKMKEEFAFKDPLQPGFAKLPENLDAKHYMFGSGTPCVITQETQHLLNDELPMPPEEVIVPMDVLKVKSFDGGAIPADAKVTDRLGDQGISLQQVEDTGVCSQAVEHESDLDMGIPSRLQQVALSSIHLDTVLDRLNTNGVLGIDPADGADSRATPTSEGGFLIPPAGRKHTYDGSKLAEAIEANLAQRKAAKAKRPCDVTMRVYVQGTVEKHLPGGGVVRVYSTATVSPRVIHWLEGDTFMVGGVTFTQTVLSFQTDIGENALEARINDYKRMLDKKDPSLCIYFEAQLKRLSVANRVNSDFVVKVAKLAYGLLDGSVTPTNSMGY